jgi:hypothetical protein
MVRNGGNFGNRRFRVYHLPSNCDLRVLHAAETDGSSMVQR